VMGPAPRGRERSPGKGLREVSEIKGAVASAFG
jgi:hypothetical protein